MFHNLDVDQKYYLYRGLRLLVEKGGGSGFHNIDRGHPIYTEGAHGNTSKISQSQDNPEMNQVYKMLTDLSADLRNTDYAGETGWYDFENWQKFCQFAVDAHYKDKS